MKRLSLTIFILFLFSIVGMHHGKEVPVFKEEFNRYEITFSNKTFSTKQLSYLSDIEVLSLTPYLNPMYHNLYLEQPFSFDMISLEANLSKFTYHYISLLEKNGYSYETPKILTNGIYIRKMIIYCKDDILKQFQEQYDFEYKII